MWLVYTLLPIKNVENAFLDMINCVAISVWRYFDIVGWCDVGLLSSHVFLTDLLVPKVLTSCKSTNTSMILYIFLVPLYAASKDIVGSQVGNFDSFVSFKERRTTWTNTNLLVYTTFFNCISRSFDHLNLSPTSFFPFFFPCVYDPGGLG